uniref:hypothetical protein n=1 Tax=Acetobacter aceti TaxID=435 RepID=UPI0021526992|nr:hypothetical protein [Acetobacter aceti]
MAEPSFSMVVHGPAETSAARFSLYPDRCGDSLNAVSRCFQGKSFLEKNITSFPRG